MVPKVDMRHFFLPLLLLFSLSSLGDIAETLELQRQREKLETRNEIILLGTSVDSLNKYQLIEFNTNLQQIAALDQKIFDSQQETITRISAYSSEEHKSHSRLAIFAFCAFAFMLLSFYFLYLMNNKLNKATNGNVSYFESLKEFTLGTISIFNPASNQNKSKAASNIIIILGLLFMLVSFSAYLYRLV